jgi:streptomycin 6-kinase
VLDLLGGGVDLLLALLATTTQTQDEVQGALLLDVVVGEGAAVLELLAGEDQALLVRGDTLLVCKEGLLIDRDEGSLRRGTHPGSWT